MMISFRRLVVALVVALSLGTVAEAANTAHTKGQTHSKSTSAKKGHANSHASRQAVPRTKDGRIQRSDAARHAFARQTGYPHGRPGYVIDHIIPLACGGADAPSNMQWMDIQSAKDKDRWERKGC